MKNILDNRLPGNLPETADRLAPALPQRFGGTVDELVGRLRPVAPLYVIWPDRVAAAVKNFRQEFPGEAMYAVKANPDKAIIQTVWKNGVGIFDASSIEEVRLVRKLAPRARICFMHPVKSPEAVAEAYHTHGVRTFVVDREQEVYKILRETGLAPDLTLFVRLALPRNGSAAIDFSSKFGAPPVQAAELLRLCRPVAAKVGLSFHVGTQTADPQAYARAVSVAAEVIAQSGVAVDSLDVGGGFPALYEGHVPAPLSLYMAVLKRALRETGLDALELLAEPGRYFAAPSSSLIVRVEDVRDDILYLNDGTYGGLFDAGPLLNVRFPVRAVRPGVPSDPVRDGLRSWRFAGPTCDSLDMMAGPFDLPANMKEGEWIEIGMAGAYSAVLRSNFNGFGKAHAVYMKEKGARSRLRVVPAAKP